MKEKTSITLSTGVLAKIARVAGAKHSRSALIERVISRYLLERTRTAAHARDLDRIKGECQSCIAP
jgi:metal-responsive CopG/Arc/MetJ family transcriptional regulator